MTGRLVRWWRQWLSAGPGGAARAPGRVETFYRNVAASVSRHATAADAVLAVVLEAGGI